MSNEKQTPGGTINFGDGTVIRGDIVRGDKREVHLSGDSSYIEHEIESIGGDYIGGNIGGDKVGGDKVGGDKISAGRDVFTQGAAVTQSGLKGEDIEQLFAGIYKKIEDRPPDADVSKKKLQEKVKSIQDETNKGEHADQGLLEKYLNILLDLAPDICEVTIATLINPAAGVALAVRKVVAKVKEDAKIA